MAKVPFTIPSPPPDSGGGGQARATVGDFATSQYLQQLASTYVGLWGVKPPPGYLEGVSRRGMNIFEFEAHERAKPAFKKSVRYAEESFQASEELAAWAGSAG